MSSTPVRSRQALLGPSGNLMGSQERAKLIYIKPVTQHKTPRKTGQWIQEVLLFRHCTGEEELVTELWQVPIFVEGCILVAEVSLGSVIQFPPE